MRIKVALAFGLLLAAALPALAQSTLDKYLKKNTASDSSGSAASEAGINKVYSGTGGFWRIDDNRSTGGACSITWTAKPYNAGYLGPVSAGGDAFFVLDGPTIPAVKSGKKRKMTLTTADGTTQTVDAFHAPNTAKKDSGIIFFRLTDIGAAMADMGDTETLTITIDGNQVFSTSWQGGHAARTAMRGCLSGKAAPPVPGATIASNGPKGRSTIIGTAYAKVALIAPRQYAPKGADVRLIHMTDELKAFMNQAREMAARGETPVVPERIKALTSYGKIEDDKGSFRFTNLPPGNYALRVNFNYKLDRQKQVDTGFARCVGDLCNRVSVGIVNEYNEDADVIKEVTIAKDGDTVTVDLSKRFTIRQGTIGNEKPNQ